MEPLSFAESAAQSLLLKLRGILVEEAGLLAGVRNDAQFIMDELQGMASFLQVLSSLQNHDEQAKTWMKQVRELAYDAEDSIDEYTHLLGRGQPLDGLPGFIGRLARSYRFLKTWRDRRRIATDLRNLKVRARDVSDRHARYALPMIANTASSGRGTSSSRSSDRVTSYDPRLYALLVEEPVGFDGLRDELLGWLTEGNQQPELGVISLVGFGGLGKTTLARMVFQSPAITGGYFQARAWIAVSQSFSFQALLRKIIQQFSFSDQEMRDAFGPHHRDLERMTLGQLMDEMDEMHLVDVIRNYFQDKRYVIVLDDIWSVSAWNRISSAFPDKGNGSRVIVTTRVQTVANTCCSRNHTMIYKMPPLSPEQSWKLFCKRVFDGPKYDCPSNLTDLTKQILKKCGGLPLAIVTVAGLLAAKPNKSAKEWQNLYDHLGSELETNRSLEGIKQVITLSYSDLPYHLKPCLLYLSIFPEDYEIERERLVRRWIAEGLVIGMREMSAEQVAEGYFDELINRSLIQVAKINHDGKVKTCRVHDIMLEVILSISTEENFVSVIHGHYTSITSVHGRVRRLALHERIITNQEDVYLSQVRSLTMFGKVKSLQNYGKGKLLRVLDLEGCKGLECLHLKNIPKLFLLNFLSVRNTGIHKLPGSIGNLKNLQFLDIRGTHVLRLPDTIVKLQRLTHLLGGKKLPFRIGKYSRSDDWSPIAFSLPKGVGRMKGLRTLGLVEGSSSWALHEIGELNEIRELGVCFSSGIQRVGEWSRRSREDIHGSLEKLNSCLRYLALLDETNEIISALGNLSNPPLLIENIHLFGRMGTLPSWFASLNQVTKITLQRTRLEHEAIRTLKDLPLLAHLKLELDSFISSISGPLRLESEGFRGLKLLRVESQAVCFEEETMQNLELLILIDHLGGESVTGMHHLRKLREVHIRTRDEELRERLELSTNSRLNPRCNFVVLRG